MENNLLKKRRQIIIHIGMHKTGSSSIQKTLDTNLNDKDFEYASLGPSNHSGIIQKVFLKNSKRKSSIHNFNSNNISEYRKILIDNFSIFSEKTMILSAEGIINLDVNELHDFKLFLDEYFESIKIVGYIRTPASYMNSAFQQKIKAGFREFDLNKVHPRYKFKFEKFDLVFGKDNVYFWKFNPKIFPSNDVVLDFCDKLHIKINPKNTIRVNESLSKESTQLLYSFNKFSNLENNYFSHAKKRNHLINLIRTLGKTPFKLSNKLLNPILEQNMNHTKWMEERLFDSLKETIKNDDFSIKNEDELLDINIDVVTNLSQLIENIYMPQLHTCSKTSDKVILLIEALYQQEVKKLKNKKINHILTKTIVNNNPSLLKLIDIETINSIIVETFKLITTELESQQTQINLNGFGKFEIKYINEQKRIIFTPCINKK